MENLAPAGNRAALERANAAGADAVIICGTTGESSTLTDAEHRNAISFAVKTVAGRIPVIAGTGSNDTAYFLELSPSLRITTNALRPDSSSTSSASRTE